VRFLVDRCVGRRLADWLREQGHDVVESRDRGPDPGDRILLEWSALERRCLLTMDKDFGMFIFVEGVSHTGLVRLPDVPVQQRIDIMRVLVRDHIQALSDGAIVTVRGERIRISRHP
jgi:predicted nuclease of predicted toxin-antitoxin system